MIDGARGESVKQPTTEWVKKLTMRPPTFDLQKEKEIFLQEQRYFCDMRASCSKTGKQRKQIVRIPLVLIPAPQKFSITRILDPAKRVSLQG